MTLWDIAQTLALHKGNGDEAYKRYPSLMELRMGRDLSAYNGLSTSIHNHIDDPSEVSRLLLQGADVEATLAEDGHTSLTRACSRNLLDTVVLLVESGASVDNRDKRGNTPIMVSSANGSTDILEFLLKRGADISSKGATSLWARVSTNGTLHGYNALMVACIHGHVGVVDILLAGGINIDEGDSNWNTPLHIAVVQEDVNLVRKLISSGALINTKNAYGISPLMMATSLGREDIVDILITNGAVVEKDGLLAFGGLLAQLARSFTGNRNNSLNATFGDNDFAAINSNSETSEPCPHVHNVRLADGRCVHMMTSPARRAMMARLHAEVLPHNFVLPIQLSGTCWFFTTVSVLFVSDRTRVNTLQLRRAMIMGSKKTGGPKYRSSLANVFLKFNIMIQNILTGNSKEASIMPAITNEDVVVGLLDNHVVSRGLNCGVSSIIAPIFSLVESLSTKDGPIRINTPAHYQTPAYMSGGSGPKKVQVLKKDRNTTLYAKIDGRNYIADSMTIATNGHVVAGLTLNGKRVIHDSNWGTFELDWADMLENYTKRFHGGNGTNYSSNDTDGFVLYNLLN